MEKFKITEEQAGQLLDCIIWQKPKKEILAAWKREGFIEKARLKIVRNVLDTFINQEEVPVVVSSQMTLIANQYECVITEFQDQVKGLEDRIEDLQNEIKQLKGEV